MSTTRYLLCLAALVGATLAAEPRDPAPEISLSLRGVEDGVIEPGEPLRVAVRVEAPVDLSASITLAPAADAWSDAVTVEIATPGPAAAVARADVLGKPEMVIAKLDADHVAGGLWRFTPEATRRIAPGEYVVRARMAIRDGAGWRGEVVSEEISLRVAAPSTSVTRVAQVAANRGRDALFNGRLEEAATLLDAALAVAPDDRALLMTRAEVALRAANPLAAQICLNRSDLSAPQTRSGPPPPELEELRARVMAAASATPSAPPPSWSWPSTAVLTLPAEARLAVMKTLENRAPPVVRGDGAAVEPPARAPTRDAVPAPPPAAPSAASVPATPGGVGTVVPAAELNDAAVRGDPAGQWATNATASSQYGRTQYAPAQATGVPNVAVAGNSPDAWCPASKDKGTEWLEVTFATAAPAIGVRVRQNDAAGAIAKVEAFEPNGTGHVWWEGVDPYRAPAIREIAWFSVRVPRTAYPVARVKLTLNLASGPGWKQVDAVQLVTAPADK